MSDLTTLKISIAGSKGGCAKSTLAHALAMGASLLGQRSMVVTTDNREIVFDRKAYPNPEHKLRPYVMFDGRDKESLKKVLTAELPVNRIVDGGADRVPLDAFVSTHSDLTIMPFKRGRTDTQVTVRDYETMVAKHNVKTPIVLIPVMFRKTDIIKTEIIGDIPVLPSMQQLLGMDCLDSDNTPYIKDIPYPVRQVCKELWMNVQAYCKNNNIGQEK